MPYSIPDIIEWMKICQPLARYGESQQKSSKQGSIDEDLDIKLYDTRKDIEYEYAQDPNSAYLYTMGNYGLALCSTYLFKAQQTTGGGGSISPITPADTLPNPYDFIVDGSSFIPTGGATVNIPLFIGFNVSFDRNGQPQYTTDPGDGSTFFNWNRVTGDFTLFNGAAQATERFRIMPIG